MTDTFATRLHALRRQRRESLREAAAGIGNITHTHLHELERGRSDNPGMKVLTAIAAYYGVTVDYLVLEETPAEVTKRRAHEAIDMLIAAIREELRP